MRGDIEFYLIIDGTDITKYIKAGGVKYQRSDVEAADSGRTMDGLMHRARVATKIRLDISLVPLTTEEMTMIQNLILPEYVTVQYLDLVSGDTIKTMYSNNITTEVILTQWNGKLLWSNMTFPLVEQ